MKLGHDELIFCATIESYAKQAMINGARILLAENNLINQEVAVEFLEKAGAVVRNALNGAEAIDMLRSDHFDCVLMDIHMPVMDGFEATRLIRADAALAEIPVIAMTASASTEDRERFIIAAGFNDFINKPFRPEMFYHTLARWLGTQPQQLPSSAVTPASSIDTVWAGDPYIIDLSVLSQLIGSNKVALREFSLKFLAAAWQDLTKIEAAMERNDLAALAILGHHNSTPAIMVGAMGLAKLCQGLEQCRDRANRQQAQDIVSQMRPLLHRINEQIDKNFA